jgi:hypothetical protein
MFPFRKKKKEDVKKIYIPVDLVQRYADEGLSESQIVSRLKSQGFEPEHIDRALKIALREEVRGTPETPMEVPPAPTIRTPEIPREPIGAPIGPVPMGERHPPLGFPPERIVPARESRPVPYEEIPYASEPYEPTEMPVEIHEEYPLEEVTVEEIVEGIVAERWRDFEELLIEFEKRDTQLQGELSDLRKRLQEVEDSITEKEKTLLSKFEEFGTSMEDITGKIGAIERVFRDFLPELTTNVKTLSELAEKIKEEKK